ncbi:tryptophan synthase subunit alpha [Microcoleus sp. LEGE 07076]|uniref:tryptophan synthase subunit alpha n=1 Tax=Microcoleus sp. LEGE 07076 TaxID=915322 RepID=UPI0018811D5A|nr:tryptophan synthase subunit alpha [Microcoleus sp. LEGE 07076]MBE9183925.1 tryptophan synthase subunit alpha [Microcoleus sp. LEGE 07076]
MPRLMTHLVANYPNPQGFCEALRAMLEVNVDFLEIQLPFTNPVADGEVIYQANQVAREYGDSLKKILNTCCQIKQNNFPHSATKLMLVAYGTTVLYRDLAELVALLKDNGFSGLIIPDLPFGRSPEQTQLSQLCQQHQLQLIPVIARNTEDQRLEEIKTWLEANQLIYAMARTGQTGELTNQADPIISKYLHGLKHSLSDYQIAVGFGIKDKEQVKDLNSQGFIAVIGTEIVRRISKAKQANSSIYDAVFEFLQELK